MQRADKADCSTVDRSRPVKEGCEGDREGAEMPKTANSRVQKKIVWEESSTVVSLDATAGCDSSMDG